MGGSRSTEKAYTGNYGSGFSPNQLSSMAPNYQQGDWSGMTSNLNKGTLATGQKIPTYQAGSNYQFKTPGTSYSFSNPGYSPYQYYTPNVSKIPQQTYSNVLNRGLEGIQQDQKMFGDQTRDAMVSRGLGRSGFNNAAQSRLGRESLQQASNLRSNIGMQQAMSELDLGKFMAGQDLQRQGMQAGEGQFGAGLGQWLQNSQAAENLARSEMDLQRQGMQAGENLSRANQSLQAQLGLSDLQRQQFGTYGTLLNAANEQALQPYQLLAGLYSPALSQEMVTGGKGDPFSALLSSGGDVAGSYFGSPAAGSKGGGSMRDALIHSNFG